MPGGSGWLVKIDGKPYQDFRRKEDALTVSLWWCLENVKSGGCSSLRIHGRDGRIQEERTYPRNSDPNPPAG